MLVEAERFTEHGGWVVDPQFMDVVLAPDRTRRPKSGMIYAGSFWARADQAGKAMFSFAKFKAMEAVTPQSSMVPASAG